MMKRYHSFTYLSCLFIIYFILIWIHPAHAGTYYVNYNQPDDSSDGLLWSTAKKTIQAALDACLATGGGEVWVRAGTYSEGIALKPGVALYGGFTGTETALSQRDWENNVTTIDGDGYYHVVIGENNATIDGFTITGGNANGLAIEERNGGGMYNYGVSPTVANCTFDGNAADLRGAGMWNDTSVTVTNCTFSNNTANGAGGGICNWDGTAHVVTNCRFINNTSVTGDGGGMYNHAYVSSTVTNCTFIGNSASYMRGGGLWTYFAPSTFTVTNCTFSGNSADIGGGMWNSYSLVVVKNCILWGNTATSSGNEMHTQGSDVPTISYSDINGCGGSGGGWDSTLGTDGGGNIDADPLFVGGGDYHLQAGSPCIDAGTSDGAPVEDFEGDIRFDDPLTANTGGGTYPYYDIGADEYTLAFYVDISNGTDDPAYGMSPGTGAWRTLHYAIEQINGLVPGTYPLNVAAGTYSIANGEADATLVINQDNVTIQGAGAGSTIINGIIDSTWQIGIEVNASNVTIAGCEVSNFTMNGINIYTGTGQIVEDCDIHDNDWGIYTNNTSPEIRKNKIYDNTIGIYITVFDSAAYAPVIKNNLIYTPTGTMENGIEVYTASTGSIASPSIYHNTIDGGTQYGIYIREDIEPITAEIKYNIITNFASGISFSGTTPLMTIDYNDVYGNTTNYDGCTAGANDINPPQDPSYVGGTDYHLQPGSPCIDAIPTGDPVSDDLEGNARPQGLGYDMGCYEYLSPTQYTLTIETVGQGSVTLNPAGGAYNEGTVVTLTAVGDSGWDFSAWSGDLTGSTNPDTISMDSDKSVTATFTLNSPPNTPTASSPEDEAILSSGPVTVDTSIFSDPDSGDTHTESHWLVRRADSVYYRNDYDASFNAVITAGDLTQHTVLGLSSGMKYVWKVGYTDSGSGQISWSQEYSFMIGTSEADSSVEISSGTEEADFTMVSFVQWPDHCMSSSALDLIYDKRYFRIGTYDPTNGSGGYVEYGSSLMIEPGTAYWFLARNGLPITVNGIPVSLTDDIDVGLLFNASNQNGWNMIGCPNAANYNWDDVQVIEYNPSDGSIVFGPTAISALPDPNAYIDKPLWRWESGTYYPDAILMEKYKGYWVKAKKANVFLRFRESVQIASTTTPQTMFARLLNNGKRWMKRWIFTPQVAIAGSDDSPPRPMGDFSTVSPESVGGCFIATAVYGSPMERHVTILRDFRDTYLLNSTIGHTFVKAYYQYSPPVADFIAKHKALKAVARMSFLPMVAFCYSALHFGLVVSASGLLLIFMPFIFLVLVFKRRV
jgi:hypothetical protein